MADDKPQYAKPASQVDLEARQKNGHKSRSELSTSPTYEGAEAEPDRDGYVGVDPIYQNAANSTEAPGVSSKGAEAKVFEQFTGVKQETLEPTADETDEDEDEAPSGGSSSGSGQTLSTNPSK